VTEVPKEWIHGDTYSPSDVAKIFDVCSQTVARWAQSGVIGFYRTPRGARRYPSCEVQRVVNGEPAPPIVKELAEADNKKYGEMWENGWHRSRNSPFVRRPKDVDP
jgi:hypothetical protein